MTLEGRYLSLRMVGKKPTSLPAIGERKDQPRNHNYIDLLYFPMIAPYILYHHNFHYHFPVLLWIMTKGM